MSEIASIRLLQFYPLKNFSARLLRFRASVPLGKGLLVCTVLRPLKNFGARCLFEMSGNWAVVVLPLPILSQEKARRSGLGERLCVMLLASYKWSVPILCSDLVP